MTLYDEPLPDGATLDSLSVAVFGLGKMGLPLATVLADNGASVTGVDVDRDVVEAVRNGSCPVANEPGLPELVRAHAGDRLRATTDGSAAAETADVSIVLVPTVLDDDGEPDLSPVVAAGDAISEGVSTGDLVVLESTVPPGTTAETFAAAVTPADGSLEPGTDFGVAHCPERTYAGRVLQDLTQSYPKIVGGVDQRSTAAAASLYGAFNQPGVIELDSATAAEAVKVFEGAYRDVNIALANELAKACEAWGIDSTDAFAAANSQPFCDIHEPGIGVGGHCIPVYPHFIAAAADETPLLGCARSINDGMPDHTVSLLETALQAHDRSLGDSRLLVLGVTYRPGVAETRYAPALETIDRLLDTGARVFAHDPLLSATELAEAGAEPVDDPTDPAGLDGIVLATGHEVYETIDLGELREAMRTPVLVDGRNFFDASRTDRFTHLTVGDGTADVGGSHVPASGSGSTGARPHPDGGGQV